MHKRRANEELCTPVTDLCNRRANIWRTCLRLSRPAVAPGCRTRFFEARTPAAAILRVARRRPLSLESRANKFVRMLTYGVFLQADSKDSGGRYPQSRATRGRFRSRYRHGVDAGHGIASGPGVDSGHGVDPGHGVDSVLCIRVNVCWACEGTIAGDVLWV